MLSDNKYIVISLEILKWGDIMNKVHFKVIYGKLVPFYSCGKFNNDGLPLYMVNWNQIILFWVSERKR
jgi:hypothetical protein